MKAPPEIFVSYAWKGESEALVDQLCENFEARGYTITRDKSTLGYTDSIQQFMDRIGRGHYIIAVINDKYMRSEYCMYEAYRMFQSPAVRERLFPIVLPDADVFSFRGQAAYLKYWDEAYKDLLAEYQEIAQSNPTMAAPLTERLRNIEVTTRFINDFMAAVGDMNVLTSGMHREANFAQLIEAIEARMHASDDHAPEGATFPNIAEPDPKSGHVNVGEISNINGSDIQIAGRDIQRTTINTGGGTYIGGNVNTGGGDFIGRDKIVSNTYLHQSEKVTAAQFAELLNKIKAAVPTSGLDADEQDEIHSDLERVIGQTAKPDPNAKIIASRLNNIVEFLAEAGATPQLLEWAQQAVEWAGQLFQ